MYKWEQIDSQERIPQKWQGQRGGDILGGKQARRAQRHPLPLPTDQNAGQCQDEDKLCIDCLSLFQPLYFLSFNLTSLVAVATLLFWKWTHCCVLFDAMPTKVGTTDTPVLSLFPPLYFLILANLCLPYHKSRSTTRWTLNYGS